MRGSTLNLGSGLDLTAVSLSPAWNLLRKINIKKIKKVFPISNLTTILSQRAIPTLGHYLFKLLNSWSWEWRRSRRWRRERGRRRGRRGYEEEEEEGKEHKAAFKAE